MGLITVLVIIISILTLFSGLTVFLGSEKFERKRSLMFFLTSIFAAIWAFSIIVFLTLQGDSYTVAKIMIYGLYISPLLMALSQIFYTGWPSKVGKVLGVIFTVFVLAAIILILIKPELLYTDLTIAESGNSINITKGWFYLSYAILTILMLGCFTLFALKNAKDAAAGYAKKGRLFYAISLIISGVLIAIFGLFLPVFSDFRSIWVGPLALSFAVIVHFYAILRYKLLFLSNIWLKVGSYIVLISIAAMLYMVIFFMVFSLLFKIQHLDTELVLMNFIMILIMLLILPLFSEVSTSMRSLIYSQDINMTYVTKKLNLMATRNVKLTDLALFLADNLRFKYIGLIVDGKVYGSSKKTFQKEELDEISMLDTDGKDIWQKPSGHAKDTFSKNSIVAVAELKNAKGRPFGQILVGEPIGKEAFEKHDLAQLEIVINLVASIIDSEKRLKA